MNDCPITDLYLNSASQRYPHIPKHPPCGSWYEGQQDLQKMCPHLNTWDGCVTEFFCRFEHSRFMRWKPEWNGFRDLGVSINGGTPIAGVYFMENPIEIRMMTGGTPMTMETTVSSGVQRARPAFRSPLLVALNVTGHLGNDFRQAGAGPRWDDTWAAISGEKSEKTTSSH